MEKVGVKPIDGEVWKSLVNPLIEQRYIVSNFGKIYDAKKKKIMNWSDNGNGYKIVGLRTKDRKTKVEYVHRLVGKVFIENLENYPQIGHKDHNKENNHVDNLYWCTQKQNTKDGIDAGRINAKKRGPCNKLTPSDIEQIATLSKKGFGVNEIAVNMGFPRTTISSVFNGRSNWALFQQFMNV